MKAKITKLDNVFSIYIRLRDRVNEDYSKCMTCSSIILWRGTNKLDNGHFMSRKHMATRWEEKNCGAQCVSCNHYGAGRQYEFSIALDSKFGKGTADRMLVKSNGVAKFMPFELDEMIKHYKEKIKELIKINPTSISYKV